MSLLRPQFFLFVSLTIVLGINGCMPDEDADPPVFSSETSNTSDTTTENDGVSVAQLQTEPLTKTLLSDALSGLMLDTSGLSSIAEAIIIFDFLGINSFSSEQVDYVSGIFDTGMELTIWRNTFEKEECYGMRFGQPDKAYFGSNDTYMEICKTPGSTQGEVNIF